MPPQSSRFFVGRNATFERDLCDGLGADLRRLFSTTAEAMQRIRTLELPLVYTDLFELPYLGAHGHWFGHLIVVERFRDGDEAIVWDNEREEPQRVANLEKALCTDTPVRHAPRSAGAARPERAAPAAARRFEEGDPAAGAAHVGGYSRR